MNYNTLYFLTDFSATYTCGGQDEATCGQPKTALQQVFVVAYLDEDRKITQINKAFHFWGEVNSQSPPSDFVFNYTCKREIIKVFQNEFPGRFEGPNK